MQGHHNEHCLGLGRQALILHGSHRELEPLKPAEASCYHSPSEVLALPLLSKSSPWIFVNCTIVSEQSFMESRNKMMVEEISRLKCCH